MYWVVTVPLTLITLGIWSYHTRFAHAAIPRDGDRRSRDETLTESKNPKDPDRKV